MRAFLIVLCSFIAVPAFARSKAAEKIHTKAGKLFEMGKYKEAAKLYNDELVSLDSADIGTEVEEDVRERLVLSLYSANDKPRAITEYKALIEKFPRFRFDPDRVFPDTIEFFDKEAPILAKPEEPVVQPAEVPLAPREITTAPQEPLAPAKTWKWYYLTPLGIGQFLAGSPVRGTILLVLELGFVAMNVAGYVLLQRERQPDGSVGSLQRAETARTVMNIGFFGVIGSAVLGIIDGAALEP